MISGLKSCMRQGYSYTEGVGVLLDDLKKIGFEMRAFTSYPMWSIWVTSLRVDMYELVLLSPVKSHVVTYVKMHLVCRFIYFFFIFIFDRWHPILKNAA